MTIYMVLYILMLVSQGTGCMVTPASDVHDLYKQEQEVVLELEAHSFMWSMVLWGQTLTKCDMAGPPMLEALA